MPFVSIESMRSPSQLSETTTLTNPGPAMLVDSTAGCACSAAWMASPTARGFLGALGCRKGDQIVDGGRAMPLSPHIHHVLRTLHVV
jgi:hypothetical protein